MREENDNSFLKPEVVWVGSLLVGFCITSSYYHSFCMPTCHRRLPFWVILISNSAFQKSPFLGF
jgi:hypothetical protein